MVCLFVYLSVRRELSDSARLCQFLQGHPPTRPLRPPLNKTDGFLPVGDEERLKRDGRQFDRAYLPAWSLPQQRTANQSKMW
ncbi:hypothetical protein CSHISOI_05303 [Colletotrichum shisoi]|uniref:Uncharacterized protein n=1 Tax=Colletotrichum shisoi TaxID=2078593 RepID=A0A5Q4BT11_9PEZI|nr:hypothetical protein CSHISOI_05303 [Colletotrichum shisoi]